MRTVILSLPSLLWFSNSVSAALFDRCNGLIYDDVLNITWLQDANTSGAFGWDDANTWADNLVFGGFDN